MYALVKIRREQLLSKSIELPIAFIDGEIGVVNNNLYLRNEFKNYPEIDYIEDVFFMELKGEKKETYIKVTKGSILFYIGKGAEDQGEWHVYNCNKKIIEKNIRDVPRYRIGTESSQLDSLQYLECIIDMICEAKKKDKRLIIFTEVEIKNENYQYRSLLDKIINNLLVAVEGIYIHKCDEVSKDYYTPTHQRFEPYINQAIYTRDTLEQALEKIEFLIKDNVSSLIIRKEYRQVSKYVMKKG